MGTSTPPDPDGVPAAPSAAPAPEDERVAALRAGLPATRAGIYLNAGTCGPLPAEAAAAMRAVEDRELTVGRASGLAYEELLGHLDEARAALAAVLGTDIPSVAVTHSTTEGMNLAIGALDWRPGDRVVTTNLEHPGVLAPLATIRDRYGVEVVVADIGDGGDDEATLAAIEAALDRGARMVALSHVAWSTGAVLPVARICALARSRGAISAIDGAQGAGAIAVAFDDMGADFYAASGQKWLLGPEGTGALAVGSRGVALDPPVSGFFSAATPYGVGHESLWPDARRFESAGINKAAVAGLARSAGWLAMYVGLPWAHERAARLARLAADRLATLPGVRLVTPRASMGTLVTFRVAGWTAEAVTEELARRAHAIVRSIPGLNAVRLSVGFFTTESELARVLDVVELVAGHAPGTLPAAPAIEFLDAPPA
jgi:L-cysteine/cystine lyase